MSITENQASRCGMRYNIVKFSCEINMVLFIVLGVSKIISTNRWVVETAVMEIVFIASAVMFNIYVIVLRKGLGEIRSTLNNVVENIEKLNLRILSNCYGQMIFGEISWIYKTVSDYFGHCVQVFLKMAEEISIGNARERKSRSEANANFLKESEALVARVLKESSRKIEAERLRKSVISKMPQNERFLSVKDKHVPLRSPELFKNKIYVTRRTLINSQSS